MFILVTKLDGFTSLINTDYIVSLNETCDNTYILYQTNAFTEITKESYLDLVDKLSDNPQKKRLQRLSDLRETLLKDRGLPNEQNYIQPRYDAEFYKGLAWLNSLE